MSALFSGHGSCLRGSPIGRDARYTCAPMDVTRRFPSRDRRTLLLCQAIAVAACLVLSVAHARDDADNPNRPDDLTPAERGVLKEEDKPKERQQVPLPAFPSAQTLIPVRGDTGDLDYNYYIDVNSVSLTSDEVLRYTIVIQSPGGASNIIYEGIRCATKEVMTLAFGTRDGRFARMANPRWQYVHTRGPFNYRTMLVELYVCDENGWAVDADTVLERLVTHDPRRPRVAPIDELSIH